MTLNLQLGTPASCRRSPEMWKVVQQRLLLWTCLVCLEGCSFKICPRSKSDLFSPSINYNTLWLISEELRSQFSWLVRQERCLIGDIHFGHMHGDKLMFRVWCVFCSWSPLTFHLASDRSRVTLDFIIWALWQSVWNKNLRHWFWKISVNRKLAKPSKVSIGGVK